MFESRLLVAGALAFASGLAMAERGSLGDPTRPSSIAEVSTRVSKGPAPRWQLQSTLVSPDRRLAVINGESRRLGDVIDGATLVDIRADGVTLKVAGRKMVFRLLPQVADIRRQESTRGTE